MKKNIHQQTQFLFNHRMMLISLLAVVGWTLTGSASDEKASVNRNTSPADAARLIKKSATYPAPSNFRALAAVLMDGDSGRILWSRNMRLRLYPASLTKVATALVFLERAKSKTSTELSDAVTISPLAAERSDSSIGLKPGERLTGTDLLYAMLLRSDNRAAYALAEHAAGSISQFAELMNARAAELGARDTHFVNPHGLHDPHHYTTAYDLALIAREALKNPTIAEVARSRSRTLHRKTGPTEIANRNKLLWHRHDADGLKTGYTRPAGRCFIASAARGEFRLIAVVMKSPDMWADASALLDYGFANYKPYVVARRDDVLAQVKVENGEHDCPAAISEYIVVPLRVDEQKRLERMIRTLPSRAPVRRGQHVGKFIVRLGPTKIRESDLVAAENVAVRPTMATILDGNAKWIGLGLLTLGIYGTLAKMSRASRRRLAPKG